jgi:hypothetical protein
LQSLAGTDGATYPFWSSDSRSIGFFADGKLKRMNIDGGSSETITDALLPSGGTWSKDGVIPFSSDLRQLSRVAASGGGADHRDSNSVPPKYPPLSAVFAWGDEILLSEDSNHRWKRRDCTLVRSIALKSGV